MDEIIIEEKKYVSSKQAAKITGYAKDYVGQLCREGRVPARLVGRSWYVLESAIQDHRFGAPELSEEASNEPIPVSVETQVISTRYEAVETPVLPSINRLREDVPSMQDQGEDSEDSKSQDLRDAWSNWFNELPVEEKSEAATEAPEPIAPAEETSQAMMEELEEPAAPVPEEESTQESVSIHILDRTYRPTLETLAPQQEEYPAAPVRKDTQKGAPTISRAVRASAVIIAVITVVLAAFGTGYFDTYLTSNSQAAYLGGISIYNK